MMTRVTDLLRDSVRCCAQWSFARIATVYQSTQGGALPLSLIGCCGGGGAMDGDLTPVDGDLTPVDDGAVLDVLATVEPGPA